MPVNDTLIAIEGVAVGHFSDTVNLTGCTVIRFPPQGVAAGVNTTLAVIAVNAPFNKSQLTKIAQMAHDGMARAIRPAHTMFDGDTVFAVSVPREGDAPSLDVTVAGTAAAEALAEAVVRGVSSAESLGVFQILPRDSAPGSFFPLPREGRVR